jgi:thymidylate synthase
MEEQQYLDLIKKIINEGETRQTRNSVTKSIFGEKIEFDISKSIPFITTKKLAYKTVIKELLWFLSGSTDNQILLDQNVGIWKGNASREYMDSIGFTEREVNDLGPVYGHQWRYFNAEYINHKTDYHGQGVDQIKNVIDLLKNDPMSRRIILSAWNPCQLDQMNLPPCHLLAQFYVSTNTNSVCDTNKELSCLLYQRSADVGLGLPFNIASYAVLTYILAKLTNMKPKKLIITIGDAHIYENHIDTLKEQITRKPFKFPTLHIDPTKIYNNVSDFTLDDFIVEDYQYHEVLKMAMVA